MSTNEFTQSNTVVSPSNDSSFNNIIWAKGDSAASKHYWREQDIECLNDIQSFNGPSVKLPNNAIINATSKGELPLPTILSKSARTANILPKLGSASLISLGQLCDDDCHINLTKKRMTAYKNDQIVLQGV